MTSRRLILPRVFTAHPLAAFGTVLTTLSAVLFVLFFIAQSAGWLENPYLGLISFVLLPALFVLGLAFIPLGAWLARRRASRGLPELQWPTLDLGDVRVRSWVLLIVVATIFNTLLVTAAGVKAIHYMDSPSFCGEVCHTQMQPHFVQWQRGPAHTKAACASCHIGTGAQGFIVAKARGTAQLYQVITGTYPTPVPTPVAHRPVAEQTCGKCHDASRWVGERRRMFTDIGDDETNTPSQTLLTLLVGGPKGDGSASGIHWHASSSVEIEYIATDASRGKIPWVRVKDSSGEVRDYVVDGFDPATGGGERRRMDCVDCHNKVAHPFAASAERVVDRAFVDGRLDARLPYLRREAVRLLKAEYPSQDQARTAIASELEQFYAGEGAAGGPVDRGAVATAVRVLTGLHGDHVFPAMKVTFGTYTSNAGHTDADGCFRCHDDEHKASDGRVITQDCESCHREEEIAPPTP